MTQPESEEIQKEYQEKENTAAAIPNQADYQAPLWLHQSKGGSETPEHVKANSTGSWSQSTYSKHHTDEVSQE